MRSPKKAVEFLETSEQRLVAQADILQKGDWLLKWSPSNNNNNQTGFELYTPPEYSDEEITRVPLGGTVLAAMYFLLEHSDSTFAGELISRANQLAEQIKGGKTEKRTLN